MTGRSDPLDSRRIDARRRRTIDLLTGIESSRKTYYPALKDKIAELEESNVELEQARAEAEHLSEELQRAVTRTASVLAATRSISRHLSLREVMRETLGVLTDSMGYAWGSIHVFREPGTRELLVEAVSHPKLHVGDLEVDLAELEFEPGFVRARDTGQVVTVERMLGDGRPLSLIFLPLISGGRGLGILTVAALEPESEDIDVCEGVALSVSLAIENATLYRRVSAQARDLDRNLAVLGSISRTLTIVTQGEEAFLDELESTVRQLTGARHVAVYIAGADEKLTPAWWTAMRPPGQGSNGDGSGGETFEGQTSVTPRALHSCDRDSDALDLVRTFAEAIELPDWMPRDVLRHIARSSLKETLGLPSRTARALCIPMRRGDALLGAIVATFVGSRDPLPSEVDTLRVLGHQVSVSLDNVRLHEKEQQLRLQAESLYRVALEQKRTLERKHKELERAQDRIRSIEMDQVVQEERARIAGELHDTVAQIVYSIGLNLDWCMAQVKNGDPLRERLAMLRGLAGDVIHEIRQSIFELAPGVGDRGLLDALRKMSQEYAVNTGIALRAQLPRALPPMSQLEEGGVFRIAQEALANTHKHSRATNAWLRLFVLDGALHLCVEDDGVGMDLQSAEVRRKRSFGLNIMRQRALAMGGEISLDSAPGEGTRVMLSAPLNDPKMSSITL